MNKTKIERKLRRKTNANLVKTIISAKKNAKWLEVSHLISVPRKKQVALNLDEINMAAKDNETVLVPGKVLSMGDVDKKIKIVALTFSEAAKQKLKKSKIETLSIDEEIKKNPDAKNLNILRGVI